ncbi:substrate-binding periplasmic protein [Rhizobium sp. SL86]|jgi:polar amino acid transport system substrate-binding protein|uniref:substrate-binding periplasmic protein n=1 Tax=Rhizobium sp. SL86 TaxID=2995148 RepID=UPI0022761A81|nr:transporter substrate-binding domain-containing protein [Rhizobium sp. SL86]MCY1668226.1 transporter substrate-binding domain-containing protein [Rhizobium sp. SL86]
MTHLVLALAFALISLSAKAAEIRFATEPYPPYSFADDDGTARGAGVEQVHAIMHGIETKTDYSIDVMPWARAIALAETRPNHCTFAAARTPEREKRFKWVTPLLRDINFLVARADADLKAKSVDEAVSLSIGTQREDYTEQLLRARGFTKIDLSNSFDLTLAKLLSGRIDLMPMSQGVFDTLSAGGTPIRVLGELSRQDLGIACNKSVSDRLIAQMQAALDRLRASGEQNRILTRFGLPKSP